RGQPRSSSWPRLKKISADLFAAFSTALYQAPFRPRTMAGLSAEAPLKTNELSSSIANPTAVQFGGIGASTIRGNVLLRTSSQSGKTKNPLLCGNCFHQRREVDA